MDFRYQIKDSAREFNRRRIAFIIYNDKVEFIDSNSEMTHWEYCQTKNMPREEFEKITRGFYLNGNVDFYKDNFSYDDGVIDEALKYVVPIKEHCGVDSMGIYFGLIITPDQLIWPLDYHYGDIDKDNNITKIDGIKTLNK